VDEKMHKKISVVLAIIALIEVCSSSLTVGAYAQISAISPTQTTTISPTQTTAPNPPIQRSYIRIDGIITQWGTTPVIGVLQTQARAALLQNSNTNQLASATAIWTTNTSRPIAAVRAKENFTYAFYAARLTNASVSILSASTASTDYFLNGTWNVFTVVSNITIITNANGQIINVHRSSDTSIQRAYGELTVTNNWSTFTLAINGIDPLTGTVVRSVTRQVQFNPFKVTDDTTSTVVTRADIAAVAQSYGSMPGWGNYDPTLDVCGHFKIDIADLSTVAANVGNS
jgi:hypothetical protein